MLICHFPCAAATDSAAQNQTKLFKSIHIDEYPIAFANSYIGLTINQNQPTSFGLSTWSGGGPSWGAEYRFFYKDKWSLAVSGAFKQLYDLEESEQSLYSISQQTLRLTRIYHPWYLGFGGRLSYVVPVRRISLPYERDPSRSIDTGAALSLATIWILNPQIAIMLEANRWRSLSTTKRQGIEILISPLVSIR